MHSTDAAPSYAPVALFVFNRPEHTRRTLMSLAANPEAKGTTLYVYSDGARLGRPDEQGAVAAVRAVIQEQAWCGEVHLVASQTNKGLAESIQEGITDCLRRHGRLIVLEDDLELATGFLSYMNAALMLYATDPQVMQISGFLPELKGQRPSTFFLRTATSWGWATWQRAWALRETDARVALRAVKASNRVIEFNLDGSYDFLGQLELNAARKLRTWAILWYASIFLKRGLVLHPERSLVNNFGHDFSGTHCQPDARFTIGRLHQNVVVNRVPLVANDEVRAAMAAHYKSLAPDTAQRRSGALGTIWGAVSAVCKRLVRLFEH